MTTKIRALAVDWQRTIMRYFDAKAFNNNSQNNVKHAWKESIDFYIANGEFSVVKQMLKQRELTNVLSIVLETGKKSKKRKQRQLMTKRMNLHIISLWHINF